LVFISDPDPDQYDPDPDQDGPNPDQDDLDPNPILLVFFCSCFSSLSEMCA